MIEYAELLKRLEETAKVVTDESLRGIAFEQLLKHELSVGNNLEGQTPPTKQIERQTVKRSKPKSKLPQATAASGIREGIRTLAISPDESGLPAWSSIGALDKYLWVLEAAHKKKVEILTASEISYLIFEIFRENHKTNQVNNLKTRIKKGQVRVAKQTEGSTTITGWQILNAGSQHLQALASSTGNER
jgi:hypothetical protein